MPRTHWEWKNRYVWNSNLEEDVFLRILKLYCQGVTCTKAAKQLARHALMFGSRKISRQTINRYYLLLGDYLYTMLPDELKFAHQVPDDFDENDPVYNAEYFIQQSIMNLHHTLYEKVHYKDSINNTLLTNKTQDIYLFIKQQSRERRGIPLETFANHFALSFWYLFIPYHYPDEDRGKALYKHMQLLLEENPLGSFELIQIRLVRE